jgi:hypothetical protein
VPSGLPTRICQTTVVRRELPQRPTDGGTGKWTLQHLVRRDRIGGELEPQVDGENEETSEGRT